MTGSSSELRRCLNPPPSSALVETGRISQVPGQPLREHALLFDPGGPDASGQYNALGIAFRWNDNVGSAFSGISRLDHTACSLAVYASRLGLLRRHHARLASRWRPTLAGQDLNLLGCIRRFHSAMSLHITSFLLRQALPGAPFLLRAPSQPPLRFDPRFLAITPRFRRSYSRCRTRAMPPITPRHVATKLFPP